MPVQALHLGMLRPAVLCRSNCCFGDRQEGEGSMLDRHRWSQQPSCPGPECPQTKLCWLHCIQVRRTCATSSLLQSTLTPCRGKMNLLQDCAADASLQLQLLLAGRMPVCAHGLACCNLHTHQSSIYPAHEIVHSNICHGALHTPLTSDLMLLKQSLVVKTSKKMCLCSAKPGPLLPVCHVSACDAWMHA